MNNETNILSFATLGLSPKILEIITRLGFTQPTPIQAKTIPLILEGKDLIGIAQTGTGKTLAFGLPIIQHISPNRLKLIVVPTRELALQVGEAISKVAASLNIGLAVVIGGESIYHQVKAIRQRPQIVVGTPGRIIDHMQQKNLRLDFVDCLVLDEADRILDMGFAPQLKKILAALPRDRQTLLFSATMPPEIINLARSHMKLPVQVEIARQGTPAAKISQELFFVHRQDKAKLLEKLLFQYHGPILIFTRTKHGARKLTLLLRDLNHHCAEIHSNRSLGQRKEALEGFKRGKYRILVATDIAARGIDVKNITLVLNYDLPDSPEDYVHRIGRTGRAEQKGHAISLATPEQKRDVQRIERLMSITLPVAKHPEIEHAEPTFSNAPSSGRSFRGGQKFGSRPSGGRPFGKRPFSGGSGSFKPRRFGDRDGARTGQSSEPRPSENSGNSGNSSYPGRSERPRYSEKPKSGRKPWEKRKRY